MPIFVVLEVTNYISTRYEYLTGRHNGLRIDWIAHYHPSDDKKHTILVIHGPRNEDVDVVHVKESFVEVSHKIREALREARFGPLPAQGCRK